MKIIYFLIIYYPVHELFLRYIGASGTSLFLLRQWPDFLTVLLLLTVFLYRATQTSLSLRHTSLIPWVFFFAIYSIGLTLVIQDNSNAIAFSNMFVLLRFTSIFWAIVLIEPSSREMARVVYLIAISVTVQAFLGWAQFFMGGAFLEAFKPADYASIVDGLERSFTTNRAIDRRILIGSMGDFISFSYFIAIGIFVTFMSPNRSWRTAVRLIMLYSVLFLAGSRTVFLCAVVAPLAFWAWKSSLERRLFYTVVSPPLIVIVFFFLQSFVGSAEYDYDTFAAIFSPRILESLMNQRLGVVVFIVPEYIASNDFLLGLSPDFVYAVDHISSEYRSVPQILLATLTGTIEDLYLVCLFLYYGLIGFSLLVIIFATLWKTCRAVYYSDMRIIGGLGILLLISSIFFNVGNQAFENRAFSFYFWLIMGLNGSLLYRRRRPTLAPGV